MKRRSDGFKVAAAACLALAIGVATLSAISAQAEPGAFFEIQENPMVETVPFASEDDGHVTLLVASLNLEILCEKFTIGEGKGTLFRTTGKALATPEYTECMASKISPKEVIPCVVTVTASPVVGLLILLGKTTYALIEPDKVSVFATINFSKEVCPLPPHVNVTGSLVLEDCGELKDLGAKLVRHLVEPAEKGLFPEHTLKYGTNEATVDGSTRLLLTGEYFNKFWKGIG